MKYLKEIYDEMLSKKISIDEENSILDTKKNEVNAILTDFDNYEENMINNYLDALEQYKRTKMNVNIVIILSYFCMLISIISSYFAKSPLIAQIINPFISQGIYFLLNIKTFKSKKKAKSNVDYYEFQIRNVKAEIIDQLKTLKYEIQKSNKKIEDEKKVLENLQKKFYNQITSEINEEFHNASINEKIEINSGTMHIYARNELILKYNETRDNNE